jgi:predicted porin
MLGLAGDWGTLATGYLQTEGWKFASKYDLMGGTLVSPLGNAEKGSGMLMGGVTLAARAQHALAYNSTNMNGMTFGVNYSTAYKDAGAYTVGSEGLASTNTTTLADNTLTELSANYEQGPLAAGFVYANEKVAANTNAANVTEWELGGNYDLTVAKLSAVYHSQSGHVGNVSTGTSYSNKVYSLAAAVPVGNDTVGLEYAKAKTDETAFGANTGATGFTLGYLHPLSKMTKLYAAYSKESNGTATRAFSVANDALSNTNLTLGGSSSLIAAGINHKF